MTSNIIVLTDKGGSTTEKSVAPVEMTTPSASPCLQVEPLKDYVNKMCMYEDPWICNSREALDANLLALWQRFASESGLVDREVDRLGKTIVGGDDITNLE